MWGTWKESCDKVAKEIIRVVGTMAFRFLVGKQVGQLNGKNGWWFVVKAQEKDWTWMRSGNTSTGSGRGYEEERMIFRCGTCVEWAQVKGSGTMEGLGR